AQARTATTMPDLANPARAALGRVWPIGAFAVLAGGLGFVFPGVSAVGAGFALAAALLWRAPGGGVAALQGGAGARFYGEPGPGPPPLLGRAGLGAPAGGAGQDARAAAGSAAAGASTAPDDGLIPRLLPALPPGPHRLRRSRRWPSPCAPCCPESGSGPAWRRRPARRSRRPRGRRSGIPR